MDRPRINKYSLFTFLFFLGGVVYYRYYNSQIQHEQAVELLAARTNQVFSESKLMHLYGKTMGGIGWNVKYIDAEQKNHQAELESLLVKCNRIFSTYDKNSDISLFNQTSELDSLDPWFYEVLKLSQIIHKNSNGAFDPTVMPLVNIWGFGPDKSKNKPNQSQIDSILPFIGFDKIQFDSLRVFSSSGMQLDFSAVAKGYAVDKLAEFLQERGYENYLVEIGGEVRCKGKNELGQKWGIQIINPHRGYKNLDVLLLDNGALATSGNYLQYKMIDGRKYSHSINPKTGSAQESNLLSASVFTTNCAAADGYATACMVMGYEEAKKMIEENELLEAYFVFFDGKQDQIWFSEGMKKMIAK